MKLKRTNDGIRRFLYRQRFLDSPHVRYLDSIEDIIFLAGHLVPHTGQLWLTAHAACYSRIRVQLWLTKPRLAEVGSYLTDAYGRSESLLHVIDDRKRQGYQEQSWPESLLWLLQNGMEVATQVVATDWREIPRVHFFQLHQKGFYRHS